MASKLIICEINEDDNSINAGSKAPSDVVSFLQEEGFSTVRINYMGRGRWYRPLLIPLYAIKLAYYLSHCDTALFQHPYDTFHDALRRINSIAFALAGKRCAKKILLVHDLHSLRYRLNKTRMEMKILNDFDGLIVHSPQMESYLADNGCRTRTSVLGLFDYKVGVPYSGRRSFTPNVVFAGNLSKSVFLTKFDQVSGGVKLFLYGKKTETEFCASLVYKGSFLPEDLSGIEGSWGLVWDGDSVDKCDGELGEYLTYNSPHKASLYVCAHLPLIVPEHSAVARIVSEYNIGITVSSLLDLADVISAVSAEQYEAMQNNIIKIADKLSAGGNIKVALSCLLDNSRSACAL